MGDGRDFGEEIVGVKKDIEFLKERYNQINSELLSLNNKITWGFVSVIAVQIIIQAVI